MTEICLLSQKIMKCSFHLINKIESYIILQAYLIADAQRSIHQNDLFLTIRAGRIKHLKARSP